MRRQMHRCQLPANGTCSIVTRQPIADITNNNHIYRLAEARRLLAEAEEIEQKAAERLERARQLNAQADDAISMEQRLEKALDELATLRTPRGARSAVEEKASLSASAKAALDTKAALDDSDVDLSGI
jgi:predicted RNase H-like nuclease (RuvC/YqgF family)